MISYSGTIYETTSGSPSIHDIAVALFRLPRWCGATKHFWPVGQHSHVVADLMAEDGPMAELAGLCHDFGEACGLGDISSGLKSRKNKNDETNLLEHLILSFGLGEIRYSLLEAIYSPLRKHWDNAAAAAERILFLDGVSMKVSSGDLEKAIAATKAAQMRSADYLNADGLAVRGLELRLEGLLGQIQSKSISNGQQQQYDNRALSNAKYWRDKTRPVIDKLCADKEAARESKPKADERRSAERPGSTAGGERIPTSAAGDPLHSLPRSSCGAVRVGQLATPPQPRSGDRVPIHQGGSSLQDSSAARQLNQDITTEGIRQATAHLRQGSSAATRGYMGRMAGEYTGPFTKQCSACGTFYDSDRSHQCHPDFWVPV